MSKKNDIGSTKLARSINKIQKGVLGDMEKKGKRSIRSVPLPRRPGKQRTLPIIKAPNFKSLI